MQGLLFVRSAAVAFIFTMLNACGDPCAHKQGCLSYHEEPRTRDGACLHSHKEQRYHYAYGWHFLKPHWRWELTADAQLTTVCDEYEQVPYLEKVCDRVGDLMDHGEPVPEDYEGCQKKLREKTP